jgi:hypothetical protein
MGIQQRLATREAERKDTHPAEFVNALEDTLASRPTLQVVELSLFAENAILAKHIAHQRGFKHHHVREFEARPEVLQSALGDVGILHGMP